MAREGPWPVRARGQGGPVASEGPWLPVQTGLQSTLACSPDWPAVQTGLQSRLACSPHWPVVHTGLQSTLAYTIQPASQQANSLKLCMFARPNFFKLVSCQSLPGWPVTVQLL